MAGIQGPSLVENDRLEVVCVIAGDVRYAAEI